jgi:hypothetical protein
MQQCRLNTPQHFYRPSPAFALGRRILELTKEIHDLVHHITNTITGHCPALLH